MNINISIRLYYMYNKIERNVAKELDFYNFITNNNDKSEFIIS